MLLLELCEGMIKRSDPWISGERTDPKPQVKSSAFMTRMENLAKQANVSVEEVISLWKQTERTVDSKLANRWMIITKQVKNKLKL